jgi:hypothetical protein
MGTYISLQWNIYWKYILSNVIYLKIIWRDSCPTADYLRLIDSLRQTSNNLFFDILLKSYPRGLAAVQGGRLPYGVLTVRYRYFVAN